MSVANPGSYSVRDVPPSPNPRSSRWYVSSTPGGWPTTPGENVGTVALGLANGLKARQPRLEPQPVSVKLFVPSRTPDGWQLLPRGEMRKVPTRTNTRPTQRGRKCKDDGSVLDSFLLGGDAFVNLPDDAIWNGLLEVCEELNLDGAGLRELFDAVAVGICARAGVEVKADELSHPYPAPKPRSSNPSAVAA